MRLVSLSIACFAAAPLGHLLWHSTHDRAPETHYRILERVTLDSGIADFLAIDQTGRRLYGAGDHVIDIDKLVSIGMLPPHTGHGFALSPELGLGIGRRGVLFELSTLKPVATLAFAGDGSTYDPATRRGFFFDDTATVVDFASRSIAGRIPLSGKPESGVADGRGRVYVNIASTNSMDVLDTHELTVVAHWSLGACVTPGGLAIDAAHHRLFVSCRNNQIAVVNSQTGALVTVVPVPGQADAFAFDSGSALLLHPNGNGTMSIIHEDSPDVYRIVEEISTAEGGASLALDPRTHRVFLFRYYQPRLRLVVMGPA